MLPLFGRIDRTSRLVATAWYCMFIVRFATVETKFSRDTVESGSQAVLPLGHLQPAHVWLLHRHRNVQECLILSNEKMNMKNIQYQNRPKITKKIQTPTPKYWWYHVISPCHHINLQGYESCGIPTGTQAWSPSRCFCAQWRWTGSAAAPGDGFSHV